MIEILEFTFRGFWTWVGMVLLIALPLEALADVVRALRSKGASDE